MIPLSRAAAICSLGLLASAAVHAEDWTLAKDEDGIRIYLSSVPGSKYKAYRGVTTIKADIAKLRALQEDVQGSCAWIHACAEQSLLKHEGNESWVYTRFEMPWPVTARDSILHVVTTENPDGSMLRKMDGQPQYLPVDKDYVRVASLEGAWTFVPKAAGEVEVTYQVHTEPGGSVPSLLANSFVVDAPFKTLSAMRAKAESR
ncbi:START domain-containing protein [Aquipseudomonas ullengensis]|uniref:START domain-containing protein n=1 Tax=Aquipseudomonas ullengensis TaxID=2759166 RepID=A0A7W4QAX9_9GAMM|nr:START domain-containing protein [Pseudomonas ullengensis]MBB2496124.1 START domain-containing protein [Pseudomonas ullengensis]